MLVPAPIFVRPVTTTWDWSRTRSPNSTCGPTQQYGPMTASAPIETPGSTTAVGWMFANSVVQDHRGVNGFRDEHAVHLRFAAKFPDVAAVVLPGHMGMQLIARKHRLAETGVLHGHEKDEVALGAFAQRVNDHDRRRLRHRLDEQNAGHDRLAREMALEVRLVDGNVLDPDGAGAGNE